LAPDQKGEKGSLDRYDDQSFAPAVVKTRAAINDLPQFSMESAEKGSKLFLSYSRDDARLVRSLSEAIQARGWSTWMDRASIPSASDWMAMLRLGHQSNSARFSPDGACIVASWLNAVSVVRYPGTANLLDLARSQVYRELSEEERAEFGLPIEGEKVGGEGDEQSDSAG
jgi:hypothetical protein